jgi:hypothetical protein
MPLASSPPHRLAGRGLPEEMAYLASDEASFVYSAVLPVDGGRMAV